MSQEPLAPRPELLEGLKERNPNLELWWDAHPGYYQVFLASLRERGVDDATLSVLRRFMSHNEGGVFFFDGVTTNPPLVLRLLESRPQVVARVQEFGRVFSSDTHPGWFDLYLMVGSLVPTSSSPISTAEAADTALSASRLTQGRAPMKRPWSSRPWRFPGQAPTSW